MQIKITFHTDTPLVLPLSHHHILQGFLYNALKNDFKYSQFLHDIGYQNGKQNYKLFCFGLLQGSYQISAPNIIFNGDIMLEVRSISCEFITLLTSALLDKKDYYLNNQKITITKIVNEDKSILKSDILVKMQSPICLSKTIYSNEKKFTQYANPLDLDFCSQVNENYIKKYYAAYSENAQNSIKISAERISSKDKYVTKFKNEIYITAWRGVYRMQSEASALTFLYNTGIGARNSQGFGMFEII